MRTLLLVAILVQGCGSSNSDFDGGNRDLSFVAPDMVDAMPPPIQLCKIITGEGCPAGQHCGAGLFNGIPADLCIPNPAPAIPMGGLCTQISFEGGFTTGDFCEPGLVCANAASVWRCRKPCFRNADCGATESCSAATTSPTTMPDPVFPDSDNPLQGCVADEHCDPVTQTGCFDPPSTRCVVSRSDDKKRVTVCGFPGSPGKLLPNSVCNSSGDCRPGVRCSGLGFCRSLCYQDARVGASVGTCNPEEGICSPIYGLGPHYGECD